MRIDHFVIHLNPDAGLYDQVKAVAEPCGFVFDSHAGRNFDSMTARYLTVGDEYLELVQLIKPNRRTWEPRWVDRFERGARGLFCIFMRVEQIEDLKQRLQSSGLNVKIERTIIPVPGGKDVVLPWRYIYLPVIEGTDTEISFIQYDQDPRELQDQFPNSSMNGIGGIPRARLTVPELRSKIAFLRKVFPKIVERDGTWIVELDLGGLEFIDGPQFAAVATAVSTDFRWVGKSISVSNLKLNVEKS